MLAYKCFISVIFGVGVFLILPASARAATLYLDPAEGSYGPGDVVSVGVKIDVDEACVNTVEGELVYPKDFLNIIDFLSGDSVLSIWVDQPDTASIKQSNLQGKVHFSGGIPGGYCGKIPGDPGPSNVVARILFVVPSLIISDDRPDTLKISFSANTHVYRNDGLGTEDRLVTQGAEFLFSDRPLHKDQNWREQINEDNIPPEPFTIEIHSRPDIFNGRFYLVFSTQDKQSGLDHFEVLEIRPEDEVGIKPEQGLLDRVFGDARTAPIWKIAKIPYLLEDQELSSIIMVKAIDNAGNERIVEYLPPDTLRNAIEQPVRRNNVLLIAAAAIILLAGMVISFVLLIKVRRRRAVKINE